MRKYLTPRQLWRRVPVSVGCVRLLKNHTKTIVIRPNDWLSRTFRAGDLLVFVNNDLYSVCRVVRVTLYQAEPDGDHLWTIVRSEPLDEIGHGDALQAVNYLAEALEEHLHEDLAALEVETLDAEAIAAEIAALSEMQKRG